MSSKKVSVKDLKSTPFITAFNNTTQQNEPVIFPNGIKVNLDSSLFNRGIEITPTTAPDVTTNRLYNENGTLKFNGSPIGSGGGGASGPSFFDERVADKIYTTGSVTINSNSTAMTSLDVIHDYTTQTFENQLSSGEGGGTVLQYGTGTTTAGYLYYLETTKAWTQSTATSVASGASQILGIALGTSPTSTGMLLKGFIRISSSRISGTPQIGSPVYVSTTAAAYTFTAPSSVNQFVRIVGYCLDTHSSDILLWFDPDSTWVEIS